MNSLMCNILLSNGITLVIYGKPVTLTFQGHVMYCSKRNYPNYNKIYHVDLPSIVCHSLHQLRQSEQHGSPLRPLLMHTSQRVVNLRRSGIQIPE